MVKALILVIFYFLSVAISIAGPRPIVLGSEDEFKEIGTKLDFLRAPTGKLTIEDVSSPNVFQKPMDTIRNTARKIYISSSLFKTFNHTNEVWLDFYGFIPALNS